MGNLQFKPLAFIDNLSVMGIGMLGVFLTLKGKAQALSRPCSKP